MIYYLSDKIFFSMATKMSGKDPDLTGSVINWPLASGFAIQDYGSSDPIPKAIFTDPQHWSTVKTPFK